MIKQKRIIQTLIDLVKIDSPSGEEKLISQEVAKRLKKLGGKVKFDSYSNIICKFPGNGDPILLNCHLDTVEPGRNILPQIKGDRIVSDGTTILGADPKAGISIILEAITSVKEDRGVLVPLEVVFSREEESSLGGAINLDYSSIKAKHGIVFDGDAEVHNIFVSSPGYRRMDFTVTGRSAHAGVEPEKGISAIEIATKIISSLKLGRIDEETTANIGLIEGGSARNAVPEKATMKGELRSRDQSKLLKMVGEVQQIVGEVKSLYPEAIIDLDLTEEFQGFKLKPDHKTIQLASEILSSMSLKPVLVDSGGGSDANIFHQKGIEVIVVGTGVWELHTTREYVVIPQMVEAARFCEKIIRADID
ncbi:hypothetical protein A3A14_02105 [Candidatus Daviesbacteria bacterium RIFCSPLOWO2_01_FULL_43_38]|uniref:Peptidase M20 dimerisation domain-containing protein n=3 Tax=Candidatus Daviesiibacteriota TaxID=1752718 RepID=A0A1F5K7M7_9BACT|nr:MAG: Di-and tripeptidase [Candidatus Daviesbacteria bacterium GW2011_GWA1_42_6]KKS70533.1 MAG: Di-and tripeptidase [Candidatus Daviesbacteria bacterium GW2011_GWA2_42_7]OGE19842.1 MAG: hypothetical protein A2874_02865 [Candidatus Daviesbacteria bacterium RIFCSPHIGHO2_01_FULL_43_17]OGE36946.1 MAG: hypothetical protein A3E45_01745 [Candidatus Daviesbacteria bacterium RIFCSPHIGHO2_12_FULL_43_11]OGE63645.1 MAG: hypothetical protein A3A14_02105 [Candidatus Daviesbacteria bacterium RIFCSPLOWO2_01_